ncbi:hypothetical protein TWF694_009750 [Orbilia ellipsospora]|uniref:DRBM domain-containing protein n=1 Tax=Orbilia ellipsospora TaxID=2528407 RepID=A0AAV9XEH3_9PEZI
MEDRLIKKEAVDYDMNYSYSPTSLDPPPAYGTMPPDAGKKLLESLAAGGSGSTCFFTDHGAVSLEMKLKRVGEYLEDVPVKNTKPPARPLSPQTFSSLPSAVKQNPQDLTKVVGERGTSSYVSELYEYIQGHRPKNPVEKFVFEEPFQQQFTVVLKIQGFQDVIPPFDRKGDDPEDTPKLFPSKKLAKEYVAKLALDMLKAIPPEPEHITVGPGKLKSESPMGELNKYCSQNALPRPHIIDTSNSKPPYNFGCEIMIDINGEHKFGDPNPYHPNKTAARNHAAQKALEWIARENPKIIKVKSKSGKSSRVLAPGSRITIDASGKTVGEIATEACAILGFKAPQKELVPIPHLTGFYNVWVNLEHSEKTTRIGPLKNIFGQKKASKAAMKATLRAVQFLAEAEYQVYVEISGDFDFDLDD